MEQEKSMSEAPAVIEPRRPPRAWAVPAVIGGAVVAILGAGGLLLHRAEARTNHVALASQPKGVTTAPAKAASFQATRRYVATIEPWVRANVGPQLVSAYVDTVLVRPGAAVKRGQVLATLDCRNTSAESREVAMRARALEARQTAVARESARISGLLDGGFVSPNEAEQKQAETASMEAQLAAAKAKLASTSLEVDDCVLKAPFDGEVADRFIDPGAFVRPGQAIVSVVDRGTVRVAADVPEGDFDVVTPGADVRLRMLATGRETRAPIARRSPAADPATRTVHFEVDLLDPTRSIPVGTSAEVRAAVGSPAPAVKIPLSAALVRGAKATVFVVDGGKARLVTAAVRGEDKSELYLDPAAVPAGAMVVVEGRALLADGDAVAARPLPDAAPPSPPPEEPRVEPIPAAAPATATPAAQRIR